MKLAKTVKHTGEREPGIQIQMRLVPLKPKKGKEEEKDKEPEKETISVAIDESEHTEGANELKAKVPVITNLHGSGVQFLDNVITLTSEIFEPKGWVDKASLHRRFEQIPKFLKGLASKSWSKTLKDVRLEFLEHCNADLKSQTIQLALANERSFEKWLKLTTTLASGKWLAQDQQLNFDAIEQAEYEAFTQYERCVVWNIGKMLWKDHGEAYENHYQYFTSQIVKPFNMPVEEFEHSMKLYAEKLKLMQPPSYKKCQSFLEADWDIQEKQMDERCIRRAIFNGLPKAYQQHLRTAYEEDWRQMDDTTFVSAMADFQMTDRESQEDKQLENEKLKQARKRNHEANQKQGGGKRGKRSDNDNKYCKYCKRAGNKFFNNHNSNECTLKEKYEKQGKLTQSKELHTMEQLLKSHQEQSAALTKLLKKVESNDDGDDDH
jgi:hypothetical protein